MSNILTSELCLFSVKFLGRDYWSLLIIDQYFSSTSDLKLLEMIFNSLTQNFLRFDLFWSKLFNLLLTDSLNFTIDL